MQCSCISFAFLSLKVTIILQESNTKPTNSVVCVGIITDLSSCKVKSKESVNLTVFSIFLLHSSTESLTTMNHLCILHFHVLIF